MTAPTFFIEIYSPDAQAFRYLAHLTCALYSFRLADCHLTFPFTFLFSSPLCLSWSIPEAYFAACFINPSLSELISQPLPMFRMSISHLHNAFLTFSWCLPEAKVYPTPSPFLFSQSLQWHERCHSRWQKPAGFVWFLFHFPLQFLYSSIFTCVLTASVYFDLFSASVFPSPFLL